MEIRLLHSSTYPPQNSHRFYRDTNSRTFTFSALNKQQLTGFDFVCAEKFKAPLEMFDSIKNLHEWAAKKLNELANQNFYGKRIEIRIQRSTILENWLNNFKYYSSTAALVVFSSLIKNLQPDNEIIPPEFDNEIVKDTIVDIENRINANKNYKFDFNKDYKNRLRNTYLDPLPKNKPMRDWVKIPSHVHDPDHFKSNVNTLKSLSHPNWTTKSFNAEPFLAAGDVHIYLENNSPKLCIRFLKNTIYEIEGQRNNRKIPCNYLDIIKKYLLTNHFPISNIVRNEIENCFKLKQEIQSVRTHLYKAACENNVPEILDYYNIKHCLNKDGNVVIQQAFQYPNENYTWGDVGIDLNKMFEKIVEIDGDLDLPGVELESLGILEKISGNLSLNGAFLKTLGNLKYVGKNLNLQGTKLEDLGNLEYVGNIARFSESSVCDLKKLNFIGNNLLLLNTKVKNLGELKTVKGSIYYDFRTFAEKDFERITVGGNVVSNK